MARPKKAHQKPTNGNNGINLRSLKKELKLIPHDIKREMRFLDLLFNEKSSVRTEVEKDVLVDLISKAKKMVQLHQNRLERYEECYKQLKAKKSFDTNLLFPEELKSLQKTSSRKTRQSASADKDGLRTGTDG